MEREQRSEGLLWDFIRANCQRMKHELAKRDCGLGQYRRDPGAAAAVILLQLHSQCVKRTHTITHTHTLVRACVRTHNYQETPCSLTHTVSQLTGQKRASLEAENHRCQREEGADSTHLNPPKDQAIDIWKAQKTKSVCVCSFFPCLF